MNVTNTLAEALDPVAFARRLGIEPEPWQEKALRSRSRRLLFAASRQSGKSTVCALLALHRALYVPRSLVLLVAPGERQALLLLRRIVAFYRDLGRPLEAITESATRLEFDNGSEVIGLPSSEGRIRGYAKPDLVIVDEASRVEDGLFHAIRPMFATGGGRLIAASTPFGPTGWFASAWRDESGEWEKYRVTWDEVRHLDRAEVEFDRRTMPIALFRAEYEASFDAEFQGQAFAHEVAARCVSEEVAPWSLVRS